uniref:Ig-like domain-containing protein n=1 Tax=Catagonus wagneri TaxID=51154 RepID=A0A8C3X6W9_9CETA
MGASFSVWPLSPLTGHVEPAVSQSPRYYITKSGQSVTLRCDPIPGHLNIYWYRQTPGKGLEFLMSIYNNEPPEKADFIKDRFSAEKLGGESQTLKIQPAEREDSAVFLCASSKATAMHRHLLPVHKLCSFSALRRLSAVPALPEGVGGCVVFLQLLPRGRGQN